MILIALAISNYDSWIRQSMDYAWEYKVEKEAKPRIFQKNRYLVVN